ncbi:MAG TPA: DNA polymerase III subunit beta [Rhodocyclaceae bacterium]|nr:DNA polymerase III subunit beta [Rhodocyclaceae bacterium]
MNVSVAQENLAKGLGMATRAVAARNPLPILGNVLLATDEAGQLRLAATDLELAITCWIAAKVEAPMAITVPARTLVDLVNTLPTDRVNLTFNQKTQTLALACGRVRANLKGIDAQDFPAIRRADLAQGIDIPAETLKEMLDHVLFAAGADQARPILTGVKVEIKGDVVILAASDGFRLALQAARLARAAPEPLTLVIPARSLSELRRLLTADEPVVLCLPAGRGQAIFHHGTAEVVMQLIDGAFPEYGAIIPRQVATRAVLDTAEFRKACRAADIFAREVDHSVRIQIGAASLTLLSSGAETGDNRAELAATVEGGPIEVAFNVKYVLDALNQMPGEQVALEVATPTSPGAIKPVGRDDYLVIVMPLHTPGSSRGPAAVETAMAEGAEAVSISAQTVPEATAA